MAHSHSHSHSTGDENAKRLLLAFGVTATFMIIEVTGGLISGSLALLADDGLSQPGIVVKTSSPKGEHERLPNPTLAVTDGSVTVKFHPWSIEQIVASEQADT